MLKIKMTTKILETGYTFNEEYDIAEGVDPDVYALSLIEHFNNTLRPKESPRELIGVETIEN